jgi:hypothetical protein
LAYAIGREFGVSDTFFQLATHRQGVANEYQFHARRR